MCQISWRIGAMYLQYPAPVLRQVILLDIILCRFARNVFTLQHLPHQLLLKIPMFYFHPWRLVYVDLISSLKIQIFRCWGSQQHWCSLSWRLQSPSQSIFHLYYSVESFRLSSASFLDFVLASEVTGYCWLLNPRKQMAVVTYMYIKVMVHVDTTTTLVEKFT